MTSKESQEGITISKGLQILCRGMVGLQECFELRVYTFANPEGAVKKTVVLKGAYMVFHVRFEERDAFARRKSS